MRLQKASLALIPKFLDELSKKHNDATTPISKLLYYKLFLEKFPERNFLFLTPDGLCDDYATFVISIPDHRNDIYFHTLNPNWEPFARALLESPDIDWNNGAIVGPVPESSFPIIDYITDQLELDWSVDDCEVLKISKDETQQMVISLPDDVYITKLTDNDLTTVNDYWMYGKTDQTLFELKSLVAINDATGVFMKASDEMVSWCVPFDYGGPGALFSKEEYRGKGYGKIILADQTRRLALWGVSPKVYILPHNTPSLNLAKSIGYVRDGREQWRMLHKK